MTTLFAFGVFPGDSVVATGNNYQFLSRDGFVERARRKQTTL